MSELVREALRQYERNSIWEEIGPYGQQSAAESGIKTEEDVVKMVHAFRRKRRRSQVPSR